MLNFARYIAIALVWGINEGNSQPIEGASLVEAFTALLDDARYESYFSLSDGSVAAGSEWRDFTDEVLSCLGDADSDYTESLLRVTSNLGRWAIPQTLSLSRLILVLILSI
jgi:hypothetical protein